MEETRDYRYALKVRVGSACYTVGRSGISKRQRARRPISRSETSTQSQHRKDRMYI